MKNSGIAVQKTKTLCQLKSRAFPLKPLLNHVTPRTDCRVQFRGHQRKMPLQTIKRNARLQAPVIALPNGRFSPLIAKYRWRSVAKRKNLRTALEPPTVASPL